MRSPISESSTRSPTIRATRSGTTTAARAGRRSSSGARAERCAGSTSAKVSTRRRSWRYRRSLRTRSAPPGCRSRSSRCGPAMPRERWSSRRRPRCCPADRRARRGLEAARGWSSITRREGCMPRLTGAVSWRSWWMVKQRGRWLWAGRGSSSWWCTIATSYAPRARERWRPRVGDQLRRRHSLSAFGRRLSS